MDFKQLTEPEIFNLPCEQNIFIISDGKLRTEKFLNVLVIPNPDNKFQTELFVLTQTKKKENIYKFESINIYVRK